MKNSKMRFGKKEDSRVQYPLSAFGETTQKLARNLSSSLSRWRAQDGSLFEIYRAKKFGESLTGNTPLQKIVFLARAASNVSYGRPLADAFDIKSAAYLGRARYIDASAPSPVLLEEWLCVRLVYGNGAPVGTGELDFYLCGDETVEQKVRKSFFDNCAAKDFWPFCSASNRMCSIRPFPADPRVEPHYFVTPQKNKHTAVLYALINKHFLDDCLSGGQCQLLSGIILNRIVDNALALRIGKKNYGTHFTPAHALLGVSAKDVRLNRAKDDSYVYRYPAYFLDVPKLIETLSDLCARNLLSETVYDIFAGGSLFDRDCRVQYSAHRLRSLGVLLGIRGKIPYSSLSGEELRRIIDERVPDGPELKLTPLPLLERSIEHLISVCRLERIV